MGLRRQAASHLQHPRGPVEVSRLLSVSEARVWSVDMEEISLTEEEGGRLSLPFTAAPALREATAGGVTMNREAKLTRSDQKYNSDCIYTAYCKNTHTQPHVHKHRHTHTHQHRHI